MKRQQKPRQRRLDLINDLKRGKQKAIARICNCTPETVCLVLNGKRGQDTDLARNIIRLAERYAENNRKSQRL